MAEADNRADFPITRFMGMDVHRTGYGTARATATIGETHHNPNGVAHGSVVFAMADTSMGAATMSILDEGFYCSTIEIQIRYLRPVVSGPIVVDTQVIKPGRRIVHLESKATDAEGRERILALVHPAGFVGEFFQPFDDHELGDDLLVPGRSSNRTSWPDLPWVGCHQVWL